MAKIDAPVAYFSHDVGMRNHRKVRVLRSKYGPLGYALWCYLLETLAGKEGFAVPFDEVEQEILAVDFGVETSELCSVVETCLRLRLLALHGERLSCPALVKRLGGVIETRQRKSEAGRIGMQKRWGNDNTAITADNTTITADSKRKEKESICCSSSSSRVREAWNATLGEVLPPVKTLTKAREQQVQRVLSELEPDQTKHEALIGELMTKIKTAPFFTDKGKGWTVTFDWVFASAERVAQIIEGAYDPHHHEQIADEYQPKGAAPRSSPRSGVTVYRDADHWSAEQRQGRRFEDLSPQEQRQLRRLYPDRYPPEPSSTAAAPSPSPSPHEPSNKPKQ